MLLLEAVLAIALVSSFWVTSPEGFAQMGAILAALLLASWALTFFLGRRALASPKLASSAKRMVIFGGALGLAGLVLGFLGGPHVAGVCVWGVGAQVVVLLVWKVASAT